MKGIVYPVPSWNYDNLRRGDSRLDACRCRKESMDIWNWTLMLSRGCEALSAEVDEHKVGVLNFIAIEGFEALWKDCLPCTQLLLEVNSAHLGKHDRNF